MPIILTLYTAVLLLAVWQDTQGTQDLEEAEDKC